MIFHIKEFYSLGIHCTEEWVSACLEWLTSDHPGLEDMEAFRLVKQQWAITDISTPGLMERFMDLQQTSVPGGQFILQVQGGYDIGSPAYGQLQKLHNVDRENARVSADDSQATQAGQGGYQVTQGGGFQQSWEPRPQRVMMLTMTDGQQTVEAMEHQTIPDLPDFVIPGQKVKLYGPIKVRRGILLLTAQNIKFLGGQVEELDEQFNLQTILQRKIGQEDVGQKGNRFASQQSRNQTVNIQRSRPAPPPPPVPAPLLPSVDNNVDDVAGILDDDDDDEMLLLAASQVEQSQPIVERQRNSSENFGHRKDPIRNSGPPIGIVQPLRTIEPSNSAKPSENVTKGRDDKRMKAQSSITSFMSSKPSQTAPVQTSVKPNQDTSSNPSFALLDSDDEFLSEVPLDQPQRPEVKSKEPFSYLSHFKKIVKENPVESRTAKVKVVSSTLASKMCLKKTPDGPKWNVVVMLNDGSDSVRADISPDLLNVEIGPALQYVEKGSVDPEVKAKFKERMKKFSVKLAELNCIVTLKSKSDMTFTVIKMEAITGLHVALMRKRRKT